MSERMSSVEERLEFLQGCPILARVSKAQLETLARAMRPATYGAGERLRADGKFSGVPLRLLVTGRVAFSRLSGGDEQRTLIRPGDVFNTETVASWAGARQSSASYAARVVDSACVLELPRTRFREVFGAASYSFQWDPGHNDLLGAFLSAQRIFDFAWLVEDGMQHSKGFRYLRVDLFTTMLVACGVVHRCIPKQPLLHRGEVPKFAMFLLDGQIERTEPPSPGRSPDGDDPPDLYPPGTLIGMDELLQQTEMRYGVVARDEALVIYIAEDRFRSCLRQIPRLASTIQRSLRLVPFFASSAPNIPPSEVTVFFDMAREEVPLGRWITKLAEYIRSEFQDCIHLIRLVPEGSPEVGSKECTSSELQITHVTLGELDRQRLDVICKLDHHIPSVILLDPSRLPPEERCGPKLFEALEGLQLPVRANVLMDHPCDWDERAWDIPLSLRRWALGTCVLESRRPGEEPRWLNLPKHLKEARLPEPWQAYLDGRAAPSAGPWGQPVEWWNPMTRGPEWSGGGTAAAAPQAEGTAPRQGDTSEADRFWHMLGFNPKLAKEAWNASFDLLTNSLRSVHPVTKRLMEQAQWGVLAGVEPSLGDYVHELVHGDSRRSCHWMVGSTRLLFPESELRDPADRIESDSDVVCESYQRWARAITFRRVGVAIGGAAWLACSAVPLIRGLRDRGIPIDILSGTSFGNLINGLYIVYGEAGLQLILDHSAWLATLLQTTGLFTSRCIEFWMRSFVGSLHLEQLAIPMIPVATDALEFCEQDIRGGSVALACRASGSMPPGAPTYRNGLRLLDGALIADVPCRVLLEEEADLVFGANSFPAVVEMPNQTVEDSVVVGMKTLDPIGRAMDWQRHYNMLFHFSSNNQRKYAHAYYTAASSGFGSMDAWAAALIADRAAESVSLKSALDAMEFEWRRLAPVPADPAPEQLPPDEIPGPGWTPPW